MPTRSRFIRKILSRLDKLDKQSVRSHFVHLTRENSAYEEILNQLQEGVVVVTSEGQVTLLNSQAASWLGINTESRREKIYNQIQDKTLAKFLQDHIPHLKDRVISDINILSPREMRLRVYLNPLQNAKEKEILVLLQNVSAGKGENQERNSQMNALISLAAGIAHEIGNPLNAIMIHLELLKKDIKSLTDAKRTSLEKALGVLFTETSRLDKIIKNFLKATRKPPLRFRAENLNAIIDDAIQFLKPELQTKKISLSFRPDPDLPSFLMDRERLYQAFLNLLKNAMEAMPKGGRLGINVSHQNKVAALTFKDEGVGIPESELPHIFEAYYTTKEEGTGLGLMTVFDAVREHGGRIEVASKVGKGTTFSLLLPIRQPKLQLPDKSSGKG